VTTEHLNILSADNPLTDPQDDGLGYAPFAKNLAESICKMSPPDGLVMAVYAPWGSGKSTLLNFIVHYLEQKPEEEQPIIVPFNPWWFSGQEDLTKNFFDQLLGVLSEKWKSQGNRLLKQLDSLAERVSTIPDAKARIFATVVKTVRPPKDIYKLKEEIEKTLKNQNKQILVVIDDIDRLTAEEIRQLFRVIKAVANFPNIIYLLLFDKEVVVNSLTEIQRLPGEAYLEKIVQVSFELPLPDKIALRRLFEAELIKITGDTPEELFQETYWQNIYFKGIEHFINTPRNIRRLINTLMVTYPSVKGEVNLIDFIAIETIRLFCPFVYNIVRHNPELFTGYMNNPTLSSFMNDDERKTFHNSWISQINEKDRKVIKNLLIEIFPNLGNSLNDQNTIFLSHNLKLMQKQLRICNADIFPVYFRLAIPEGDISHTEMIAILSLTKDANKFALKLVELSTQIRPDGTNRVRVFLKRLRDYADENITLDCIPSILHALFDIGDQLWRVEDERNVFFNMGNEFEIELLINQLLERIEKPKRGELLKDAMLKGQAIATIVWQVISLGEEHGKYESTKNKPESGRLVNTSQLEELEQIAVDKLHDVAKQDYLLKIPDLRPILAFWRDTVGEEEVRKWIQKVIQKDKDLVDLLENLIIHKEGSIRFPQWMSSYWEGFSLIQRIETLIEESWLTDNQKLALRQFIKEHKMSQQDSNK
jgi:predicted KAP-like P-loop ATPase